ncbi:tetratricopeptide repeat protein [Bacteroides congonensis]
MKKEKMAELYLQAQKYKEMGKYPEALSNLHQIVNAEPGEVQYIYLLAASYFEIHELDSAQQYINQALLINANYKEAIELQGMVDEVEKKYKDAEACYKKCLEIEPDFLNARADLVRLYSNRFLPDWYQELEPPFFTDIEELVRQANILVRTFDVDKMKKLKKKEKDLVFGTYSRTYRFLEIALVKLKKYKECAFAINQNKQNYIAVFGKIKPMQSFNDDLNLLKLYHVLGYKEKETEMKEYIKFHNLSPKDYEEIIAEAIQEAEKGLFVI